MNITITAEVVGWYGAIVGTGSLVVSGLNAWRDRARIVVTARPGYRVQNAPGYSPDKLYVAVTVANRGRRPVTISHVWVEKADSTQQKMLLDDSLLHGPREITEGKAAQYLMDQTGLDLTTIKRVYAGDMAGRNWSAKFNG
jgi:hypothetical protein